VRRDLQRLEAEQRTSRCVWTRGEPAGQAYKAEYGGMTGTPAQHNRGLKCAAYSTLHPHSPLTASHPAHPLQPPPHLHRCSLISFFPSCLPPLSSFSPSNPNPNPNLEPNPSSGGPDPGPNTTHKECLSVPFRCSPISVFPS
jgi:hypothetical protein